ncbi:MAG TPA: DedA family protein [Gemmatimonadales bacterium]|nr:DedA family protein [Gemmatimonadales bacterium]
MDLIRQFVDFFVHLDQHLAEIISRYGTGTYLILFLIIFAETGLVVMPLLPGDSLLFAAGAFAALGDLNPWLLNALLVAAAILGDTVNYWVGKKVGPRAFSGEIRFLKREYLDRTQGFYQRHGGKTIILARFVPIVRTFAPFVAGVGEMNYPRFLAYNVVGGVVWVTLFVWAGYLFGNIPAVKDRFSLVILAIIAASVIPVAVEIFRGWRQGRVEATSPDSQ